MCHLKFVAENWPCYTETKIYSMRSSIVMCLVIQRFATGDCESCDLNRGIGVPITLPPFHEPCPIMNMDLLHTD